MRKYTMQIKIGETIERVETLLVFKLLDFEKEYIAYAKEIDGKQEVFRAVLDYSEGSIPTAIPVTAPEELAQIDEMIAGLLD